MLCKFLYKFYPKIGRNRFFRNIILNVIIKLEKGEFYSVTARKIAKKYHGVEIGLYTHGGCFNLGMMDTGTKIGRYCSIARGVRVVNLDHRSNFKSTHAFFFNSVTGYTENDLTAFIPISIGNDVWLGTNAIILPNVRNIGDGAIVAAGAVVNKDVPPYAIVVGNPGRVVRFRFPPETIKTLLEEAWWERSIDDLKKEVPHFQNFIQTIPRNEGY